MKSISLSLVSLPLLAASARSAEIVSVKKIWIALPHNAFTDLVRFNDRWFCVFREGKGHVSPGGALRVITSEDGDEWKSAALITDDKSDLRDAKITVTPDQMLMLSGAGALHPPADAKHQSKTWFSKNGGEWSKAHDVGQPDFWLWRTTWHKEAAWGVGYSTTGKNVVRLYRSDDGKSFDVWVEKLFADGYSNETSLVFLKDETCLCLLRRDGNANTAQLGSAKPPYKEWKWRDLGMRVGGPHMLLLPDGRLIAAGRRYMGGARTQVWQVDADKAKLTELVTLPSGGDTSYPGLVWHDGFLWMSYYSSHEGKTSIYLAKIDLDAE